MTMWLSVPVECVFDLWLVFAVVAYFCYLFVVDDLVYFDCVVLY